MSDGMGNADFDSHCCSDIMHDNMIVNVSGLPGHFMAVDLNIEHLIGYLKVQEHTMTV